MVAGTEQGALVISLDFELHWGVRDLTPLDHTERARLLAARAAIPHILQAFGAHDVRATWATVGLLFARSRDEAHACRPPRIPHYRQSEFDPYAEVLGSDESDDPFHFAPSLIRQVAQYPGQELGSHSYSHFLPLETGQGEADFEADLQSAQRIAAHSGYQLSSYVFPRNQVRRSYLPMLGQAGFTSYRGNESVASKAPVSFREARRPWRRALRWVDAYWDLNGTQTMAWPQGDNPVAVNASRYLRPYSPALRGLENVRLQRIAGALTRAALDKRIFHLWWHPEDFARETARNIEFLHRVLNVFDQHRRAFGMASLSMRDVGAAVNPTVHNRETELHSTLGFER